MDCPIREGARPLPWHAAHSILKSTCPDFAAASEYAGGVKCIFAAARATTCCFADVASAVSRCPGSSSALMLARDATNAAITISTTTITPTQIHNFLFAKELAPQRSLCGLCIHTKYANLMMVDGTIQCLAALPCSPARTFATVAASDSASRAC